MNFWTWKKVLFAGGVLVIAVWLGGPYVLWTFRDDARVVEVGTLGPIGDAFGVSTSLFSGLGLLGVAVVLYHDMRERRRDLLDRQRARRPLLLPEIEERGALLVRAAWTGNVPDIAITIDMKLVNATGEPALNVGLGAKAITPTPGLHVVADLVDGPIKGNGDRLAQVHMSAHGDEALKVLAMASNGSAMPIALEVLYTSVNSTAWRSSVSLEIKSRPVDRSTLQQVLDHEEGVEVGAADTPLALGLPFTALSMRGTWKQDPA